MKLTGAQFEELVNALVEAFPTYLALAQMVRFGLGVNLATIAAESGLTHVAFQLAQWAESQGRLEELVRQAYKANPGNPRLRAFVAANAPGATASDTAPVPATPQATGPASEPSRAGLRALRDALAALYPHASNAARVADDAGLERARIEFSGSAITVWHAVLDEAVKSGQLQALVEVVRNEYPNNPVIAGLARGDGAATGAAPAPKRQDATSLYDALCKLLPSQFEEVVFRLGVASHHLPSPSAALSTRASELVKLQAQGGDASLGALADVIARVTGRHG